ncbi:MAG: DUF4190 domain-containing protein, partial [Actinobacteria bacterium]|nr:DUF4190 domain-containing protein [Actinomycetota bacterium]
MTNPTDPTDPNAQQPVAPAAPAQPVQPVQSAPQYAAPAQPAPQAPGQYSAPQYVAGPKTNTLSIIALVSAFVLPSIVPIVLGHISLSQIKKTGENGRGMALAA